MKINLSLAAVAAVALAIAASPADAASKKGGKSSKAAKVTVSKPQPYFTANWNACGAAAGTWWFPFAVVGSVGCAVVYAIPVAAEGFLVPQGGGKA